LIGFYCAVKLIQRVRIWAVRIEDADVMQESKIYIEQTKAQARLSKY